MALSSLNLLALSLQAFRVLCDYFILVGCAEHLLPLTGLPELLELLLQILRDQLEGLLVSLSGLGVADSTNDLQ